MTIKDDLRKLLTDNKDALADGKTLQLTYQGSSPAYVKLAVYTMAKELGLQLTCSVRDGYLELRQRQIQVRQVQLQPKVVELNEENDLSLDDVLGTSK